MKINNKLCRQLGVLFLLAAFLSGCGLFSQGDVSGAQSDAQATNTVEPVIADTLTPVPTDTPTSTPTEEPTVTPTSTTTPSPTPLPTATPMPSGPTNFPPDVNPLTGLVVPDPSLLDRNPVMIKVSNFPRSLRPHSGLSAADLVFEYTIGEGATRFSAVYYGQDAEKIGPVRSGRLIDASIASAYQSVLAFASADPYVYSWILNRLGDRAISLGQSTCPALCRTGTGDVNSVFGDSALLTDYALEERGLGGFRPIMDGTRFDPAAPEGGQEGTWLQVQYSFYTRSEWRYDPASGAYLRWIEEESVGDEVPMVPLVDRETGEQLAFDNVVILFAQHNVLKPTLHEVIILGNGTGQRALFFRDGKMYQGFWRAVAPDRPLQFLTPASQLMALKPGNTWFQVVGLNSAVNEVEPGQWEAQLFLP